MRTRSISAALAALALCGLLSCVKEVLVEDPAAPEKAEKTWTVTVDAAKAEQDPETKALLLSDDEREISFYWSGTDEVEVYDAGGTKRGTLVPDEIGTNTTKLKGTLSGDFTLGDSFTLYYQKKPAAENAYAAQKGTVEDISKNFDFATASVEVKEVDPGTNKVTFTHAAFESRQSITKFLFQYVSQAPQDKNIVKLTILAPGRMDPVTVIPDTPAQEFHVALPKIDSGGEKVVYTFLAEVTDGSVYEGTKKAALQEGKYYKGTVRLYKYDPIATPLTIEALEDGAITISNPLGRNIRWNAEEGVFSGSHLESSTESLITIPVTAGQRVILGGIAETYAKGPEGNNMADFEHTNIRCSARHYMYGNVMSLRDITSYAKPSLHAHVRSVGDYAFAGLFKGLYENRNTTLYNHPVKTIELPATTVGKGGYFYMFAYCTSLEVAPELPATTFSGTYSEDCREAPYGRMFGTCVSLKKGPSRLPANTVKSCYWTMFYDCISLEASPILEDETPADYAYQGMFSYCENLKQITCYSRNNLWPRKEPNYTLGYYVIVDGAPLSWVNDVSPTGVFIKHPNASWPVGDSGIPKGWSYDKDPLILEAIEDGTLTVNNPQGLSITWSKDYSMAAGSSSSLATINIPVSKGDKVRFWGDNPVYSGSGMEYLNTTFSGSAPYYAYGDIRSLVSSSNYPNLSSLSAYAFAGLFRGDTNLRSHDYLDLTLGAASVGERAFEGMFSGCTGLKRAPELPATTLASECYAAMFSACTALEQAPELPATNLANYCYSGMFRECSRLETAPALPATKLKEGCYMNMFDSCGKLLESPELKASTLVSGCYSYMFRNCTSLQTVTCLATNPGTDYTSDWLDGVSYYRTFVKENGVSWPTGPSGIPASWTVQSQ